MISVRHFSVYWAACAVFACLSSAASAQSAPASGDAAAGKVIFRKAGCYECHGYNGQGSMTSGPRIASPAPPFLMLRNAVRTPSNIMPAYAPEVLDDTALQNIYAYLQSQPRAPRPADLSNWLD
jgi:mono/diheme cytochrome c family protein